MNKTLRFALASGMVLLGIGVLGRRAEAASTDTITLSVTPGGFTYSVQITSVNGSGYQFGTVAIGGTTVSTAAITVANTGGGNVAEYFGMKVSNTSPDTWTPGAPGIDTFRLIGELTAGAQPVTGITGFPLSDAITGSFPGSAGSLYSQGSKTAVGSNKKLWLQLEMPTSLSSGAGAGQTMTLFVAGMSS